MRVMAIVKLKNVTQNKTFVAKNNVSIVITKSNPVSKLILPETPESDVDIVKIEGVDTKITVRFMIKKESSDVSDGTRVGGLTEFWDIVSWLVDYFVTPYISENHKVEIVEGNTILYQRSGVFTSLTINLNYGAETADVDVVLEVGASL